MALDTKPAGEITRDQIIKLIEQVEDRHRVVWTAGRLLIEDGSLKRIATAPLEIRKPYFSRLRKILKGLAEEGILSKRRAQFNYGTGTETAYDFIGINSEPEGDTNRGR